jgi:hypothetical protein
MAGAFEILQTAGPVLKKRYDDRKVWNLTFGQNKLFGWMPRTTGITGKSYEVPVTLANIAGGSSSFAEAVKSRRGTSHERWSATRSKSYQTATIDNETLRAMKNDKGAFFRAVTSQLDAAYRAFGSDTGWAIYQDGSGVRGTVASEAADVVTLGAGEARAFAIGMRCFFYPAASDTSRGEARVTAINRSANQVTFDSVPAGVVATDRVVRAGDLDAKINGLAAIFPDPTSITSGDSFYGVDRSVYKERLLGLHYDGSQDTDFADAIRNGGAVSVENEGSPDVVFMNPMDVAKLDIALDGDREFDKVASQDGHAGFDAIKVHLGGPVVSILSDPWCPADTAYMLQRDTLEVFSIDRVPDFVSADGNMLHRLEDADEVEFRIGAYFNVLSRAPGYNVVIALA